MPWLDELQVFCADIGSIARDSFAWARRIPGENEEEVHQPESIEALAAAVVDALRHGQPVALGFEAPMFVPVPEQPDLLGKARPCDAGSPSWSSQVGASVLATAAVQVPWILRYVRERVPDVNVHVSWESFASERSGLLLWEAFVSGAAKGETHEEDARNGVQAFCDQLPNPGDECAGETQRPFSLLAAAAVWAGGTCRPRICAARACSFARCRQALPPPINRPWPVRAQESSPRWRFQVEPLRTVRVIASASQGLGPSGGRLQDRSGGASVLGSV